MGKGRKLSTSRSEVLLGSYGYGGNTIETDSGEFEENDVVWSMVDGMVNHDEWNPRAAAVEINAARSCYRNSVWRGGGGGGGGGGEGLSSAIKDSPGGKMIVHQIVSGAGLESPRGRRHVANSAPVNVPDWSKIYRVDSADSLHDDSDETVDYHDSDHMVPPHEYLARVYGKSRNSAANSVFVGAGRTLKGRDLSRVRDAVWSQTGFNG